MNFRTELLDLIYRKSNLKISSKGDCIKLSQLIYKETNEKLSESTLYRILIKEENIHNPYKNTLNVIAKYLGFLDWDFFVNYCESNKIYENPMFLNNVFENIIGKLIENEKFNSLIEIFETTADSNYRTKEFIGLNAFKNFKNFKSFSNFVRINGRNPFVRNILIEALYDPYHRIPSYQEGIENYLKHTEKNSLNYNQDFIFSNTVLFRNYILTNQTEKALEIGNRLYKNKFWFKEISELHLFPKTRFLSYYLWYLFAKNVPSIKMKSAINFLINWADDTIKVSNSIIDINIVYQTVMEVLISLKLNNAQVELIKIYEANTLRLGKSNQLWKNNHANGLLNFMPL
jgi:hypothetical protein